MNIKRYCQGQTIIFKGTSVPDLDLRLQMSNLIKEIETWPELATYPLKHTFPPGLYVREITIPAGHCVVGKIHKHAHLNFLSKGKVVVRTKDGVETLQAPCTMISSAGTQRALYTYEECVWTTVHLNPTDTHDLAKLEDDIIAPTYDALELFERKFIGGTS